MTTVLPPPPAHIHFVGIGGIGMSGLARILRTWGYKISGSDAIASPLTSELASEGMAITIGHSATEAAAEAALVVTTAAVSGSNPELVAAREAGVPVVKRAALLGLLANARFGVAVAGSHGKSSTCGMIVTALGALGADPTYAIGAVLASTGTNAAPGNGPHMVVEADEYDYSFLALTPDLAIITNIEFDHPDLFPDQETYDSAFARFVAGIKREGTLVIAADDPGCRRLRSRPDFAPPGRVITFGDAPGDTDDTDWKLTGTADGWQISGPDGVLVPLAVLTPGAHMLRNATAALSALVAMGYAPARAAAALAGYAGVGRRFEVKGEVKGVLVIDDYAHHPSEIRVNLVAARERYPDRRLWAVFQPHTFSRLKALLPEFGVAFDAADRVMILDVYAAREVDDHTIGARDLLALLPPESLNASDPGAAASKLVSEVRPGDVVLTMGAGTITETGPHLMELLRRGIAPPAPNSGGARTNPSAELLNPATTTRQRRSPAGEPGPTIPAAPQLKVLRNAPMSLHTTWRVGGPADLLVRAPAVADLRAAVAWGAEQGLPVTVLGGGSNLLVGDGGIRGLVILARTPGERAEALVAAEDLGEAVRLRVAAQAPLSWTGRFAAERGWSGLDWGVGLPGTIGGATVNNAGAHGTEQKDHLERVVVLDNKTGAIAAFPASWMEAAYRHTILKATPHPRPYTVIEIELLLPKGDPVALVQLADEHAEFRKQTQPTGACGGSTFANPPADFAGRLLEAVGMKGYRVGGAAFSPKHSNWIVNDQKATAADIRELIATARERVRSEFGIELRQEVEEIGEW